MEKMTKIARCNEDGSSTSLYAENFTIVESTTAIVVKIKMKISDVFLFSVKVV
jgi:hypothetical protein